ncbi:MAG: hypothetical protein AB8H79_16470 [Myxococcota bacterium]
MLAIVIASLALAQDGEPPATPDADPAPTADEATVEGKSGLSAMLAAREAPEGIWLSVRGTGELWHDPYLASRFATGGITAGVGVVVPITGWLAVDAEVGYHRKAASTGDGTLQLAPMALLVVGRLAAKEDSGLELFGGFGPAIVMWSESGQGEEYMRSIAEDPSSPPPTVLRGSRPGFEVRLGTRIDLGLVQTSLAPGAQDPVKAVALEIVGARRFATSSAGFNLNTWRFGAGLAARF